MGDARPPTRDQIARLVCKQHTDVFVGTACTDSYALADALLAEFSIVARGDTPPAPADARAIEDIRFAARSLRASSWPGEMGEEMEQRSRRLDEFADSMDAPRGVTPDPQTEDAAFDVWFRDQWAVASDVSAEEKRDLRTAFIDGARWARAAVGDSTPTP